MKINNIEPKIRHLSEMQEVLFDRKSAETTPDPELYYMYRDLAENDQDRKKMKEHSMRYDITVINPAMLGIEYNKTAGHDHPLVPKTKMTYPELYEVLEGKVFFLMQDSKGKKIKNIFAIEAKKGDKVIIPPNYEHIIINTSKRKAKTANWISNDFDSNIYEPFKEKQGFSYYAIKDKSNDIEWIRNNSYEDVPELEFLEPNLWLKKFGIDKDKDIYTLVKDLSKLDFLKNPQKYKWGK